MVKVLAILTAIGFVILIGCQATGVSREELDEVKTEIKVIQEYLDKFSVHYEKTTEIQRNLLRLQLKIPPEARVTILKGVEIDTHPRPRPPWPPLEGPRQPTTK